MVNVMLLGCTAAAAFACCLALPPCASATAAPTSTSAAASMRAVFGDWGAPDAHLQRNLHGSDGTVLRQLDLLPRGDHGNTGYIGVHTFERRGTFAHGGASAPTLSLLTGGGTQGQWWLLAFETAAVSKGGGIGFALFASEAELLNGTAARVHLPANAPLQPASQRTAVAPSRYSSPTVYAALHSQRGGRETVDVILGVAWTDAANQSHPANAMLSGLSLRAMNDDDQTSAVDYNTFFSYDGQGCVCVCVCVCVSHSLPHTN